MKTEGHLRDDAYRWARLLLMAVLAAIVLVSLATPFLLGTYWDRWFAWPTMAVTAPVPVLVALVALALMLPDVTVVAIHLGLARSSRRQQLARLVAKAARIGSEALVLTGGPQDVFVGWL